MRRFLTVAVFLCFYQSTVVAAQSRPSRLTKVIEQEAADLRAFERFVRQQTAKNKVPGLTIGFIKGDYIWVKGFGYANVESRVPATAASVYRFASVQQSMTDPD